MNPCTVNMTGAERGRYDLSTADGGAHDTHTTHERRDALPAAGKQSRCSC